MKRKFKVLKIVLISLLTLLVLVVGLVCAALFTPLRNVLISKALESTLEAKVEIGGLRLKVFRTWPELSLDLDDISVTYPAPSDTVLGVSSLALRVNVPNVIHGFIDVPELALSSSTSSRSTTSPDGTTRLRTS